jgi:DNA polymerase-3 subunit alpha
LLGITNLDSIKYDLDFGRFLTIERKDLPDVDVDVSDRARVIEYLTQKYGEDRVVQVMNIVYTSPITSIRDIGKLLGFPYKEMEKVSKGFVQDTWEECLQNNKDIANNPKYKELLEIAGHITNRPRGYGIHAGGVIVCRHPYDQYIGIRRGQGGEHVISVDKIMDEKISLVKYDCLGVASLVAINEAMQEDHIDSWEIDINNPKFEHDEEIFNLICSGKTDSLFQIESAGMKDLIARLQPRSLENLTATVALYRPDAMPAIDGYIQGKNTPSSVTYIHPDMEQILGKTYGQNIYQEQSMRMTKVFGGRSDAGADRMRKCLAKKNPEKVKEEVTLLHQEILGNGYSEEIASKICEELSTKGGYGLTKVEPLMLATA